MLELLQVERPDLTELEVDELLDRAACLQDEIDAQQQRLDAFIAHYNAKIEKAHENFTSATKTQREELAIITDRLDRWARKHITGKRRSVDLPSGKLTLTKQQPLFYLEGERVTGDNPALIELARNIDADLVKTTETADWATLKKRLTVADDGTVYVNDTGEVLADLRAELRPDKFDFKTA